MANIRIQLRTKRNQAITDYTDLLDREIQFDDINDAITFRDGSGLSRFHSLDDSVTDSKYVWSSQQITDYISSTSSPIGHTHNYYDLSSLPQKNVLLTANGIGRHPTRPCGVPMVIGDSAPLWRVFFDQSAEAVYSFKVPGDYTGLVTSLNMSYSVVSAANWRLSVDSYAGSVDATTGSSSVYTNTIVTAGTGALNTLGHQNVSINTDLLGSADSLISLQLTLLTDTTAYFYGMSLDYS